MLAAVALGGALGAVGRYLVMSAVALWFGLSFPWGTLIVNVVGSFAMGALVEISALVWSPSPELRFIRLKKCWIDVMLRPFSFICRMRFSISKSTSPFGT